AADQRASGLAAAGGDPGDDLCPLIDRELPGREVIEEEKWLAAMAEQIVHAHGDKIDADGRKPARLDRDPELGADAIGGRQQNRVAIAGSARIEERREPAERIHGAGPRRRGGYRLDAIDKRVPGGDVDTR